MDDKPYIPIEMMDLIKGSKIIKREVPGMKDWARLPTESIYVCKSGKHVRLVPAFLDSRCTCPYNMHPTEWETCTTLLPFSAFQALLAVLSFSIRLTDILQARPRLLPQGQVNMTRCWIHACEEGAKALHLPHDCIALAFSHWTCCLFCMIKYICFPFASPSSCLCVAPSSACGGNFL